MNNDFCYLLRVRYAECDAQKVVFNGRYVDYIDIAFNEFVRAVWGNYDDLLAGGIDNQVVNLSVTWKAPAHFDEVVAVTVRPGRIGNTSYTLEIGFYNYETGEEIASGEIVYVMVGVEEHRKMTIPDGMRAALEKGASGVVVDHAGVLT